MTGAHSFPRKILPNSANQFTKFCGSPRQDCPYSAAYRDVHLCCKLSFILLKKPNFWRLKWHSVMVATYKENY